MMLQLEQEYGSRMLVITEASTVTYSETEAVVLRFSYESFALEGLSPSAPHSLCRRGQKI